jgi:hypothetical protein
LPRAEPGATSARRFARVLAESAFCRCTYAERAPEHDDGTRATYGSSYESAEALKQVLDMGMVEGSTLAINQIDDLIIS